VSKNIITNQTAISLFADLLIADIILVALLTPIVFSGGWLTITLFIIGLWVTSHSLAVYARRIFPKKVKKDVSSPWFKRYPRNK
jgi:hypothetical protein